MDDDSLIYYNMFARVIAVTKIPREFKTILPSFEDGWDAMEAEGWSLFGIYLSTCKLWYHQKDRRCVPFEHFAQQYEIHGVAVREERKRKNRRLLAGCRRIENVLPH